MPRHATGRSNTFRRIFPNLRHQKHWSAFWKKFTPKTQHPYVVRFLTGFFDPLSPFNVQKSADFVPFICFLGPPPNADVIYIWKPLKRAPIVRWLHTRGHSLLCGFDRKRETAKQNRQACRSNEAAAERVRELELERECGTGQRKGWVTDPQPKDRSRFLLSFSLSLSLSLSASSALLTYKKDFLD